MLGCLGRAETWSNEEVKEECCNRLLVPEKFFFTEILNAFHSAGIIVDGNKDGVVNVLDLNGFTQILLGNVSSPQPYCWPCRFDILSLEFYGEK